VGKNYGTILDSVRREILVPMACLGEEREQETSERETLLSDNAMVNMAKVLTKDRLSPLSF
jgi:hypothetical protein